VQSDAGSEAVAILQSRMAILRDVRFDEGVVIRKGSLVLSSGRETREAVAMYLDREEVAEHWIPIDSFASLEANGRFPGRQRVSILFSAIVGSRAQALATDDSDTDRRGFYIASPDIQFGLEGPPDQLVHDGDQLCYWELEKFLRLALKANPTVLETLYSPEIEIAGRGVADDLSELKRRGAFLSKRAQRTFMRCADSQFEKMTRARESGGVFKWQHAMHLIRLLRVGIRLMRSGELSVVVPQSERAELLAIKQGERGWDDVCGLRDQLVREFEAAAADTPLPEEPNTDAVNRFLVSLRIRGVEEASR